MLIGKKWKIEADNLNVILFKKVIRKPKDKLSYEDWEIEGYYSSVTNALKGLVDFGVKETELKDLQTVFNKIDELGKLIDKAFKGVNRPTKVHIDSPGGLERAGAESSRASLSESSVGSAERQFSAPA